MVMVCWWQRTHRKPKSESYLDRHIPVSCTASIVKLHSGIGGNIGWHLLQGRWSLRTQSKASLGPAPSLGSIPWALVASDSSIQDQHAATIHFTERQWLQSQRVKLGRSMFWWGPKTLLRLSKPRQSIDNVFCGFLVTAPGVSSLWWELQASWCLCTLSL